MKQHIQHSSRSRGISKPSPNANLMQLRENSRKNSIRGPGSYANTDLAKMRAANFKGSGGGKGNQCHDSKGEFC